MLRKIFLIFFITLVLSSCKNVVHLEQNIENILNQYNSQGVFIIYDYSSEELLLNKLKTVKDSFFNAQELGALFASFLLIEEGVFLNETKKYSLQKENYSLSEAFWANDTSFFEYYCAQLNNKNVDSLIHFIHFKPQENVNELLTKSHFQRLQETRLTLDQTIGFVSKLYFKKLPFQERTLDIIKSLFSKKMFFDLETHTHTFYFKNKTINLELGWFEKNNKPYFFLFQSDKDEASTQKIKHAILSQYQFLPATSLKK